MNTPGETYEEWRARTAPTHPVRTLSPRMWDWGVMALLAVFFVWFGGGWHVLIGLALPVVLGIEVLVARRDADSADPRRDRTLRGGTLLVTLALSGLIIWVDGGVAAVLPVLLVLLDLKDDRSFLRWVVERLRTRRT